MSVMAAMRDPHEDQAVDRAIMIRGRDSVDRHTADIRGAASTVEGQSATQSC